jgi:outer membrane protein OmpA-like peptidoglycan-associated protein
VPGSILFSSAKFQKNIRARPLFIMKSIFICFLLLTAGCAHESAPAKVEVPSPVSGKPEARVICPPDVEDRCWGSGFPASIFFRSGSARIDPSERTKLDIYLSKAKNAHYISQMLVVGHTDSRGNAARNQRLSESRADAVREFLVAGGLGNRPMEIEAYGQTHPVADNATNAGRKKNRRVDVVIFGGCSPEDNAMWARVDAERQQCYQEQAAERLKQKIESPR